MALPDAYWMQQALQLAKKAQCANEVPVGAVIVSKEQKIIGEGWNQVILNHDPCAHAELIAIQNATKSIENYRLKDSTLYVTLEPCCMCAGAIVHARIKRVVFACRDLKAGAAGSAYNLLKGPPLNHKVQIDEGCMEDECSNLLKVFFQSCRKEI